VRKFRKKVRVLSPLRKKKNTCSDEMEKGSKKAFTSEVVSVHCPKQASYVFLVKKILDLGGSLGRGVRGELEG